MPLAGEERAREMVLPLRIELRTSPLPREYRCTRCQRLRLAALRRAFHAFSTPQQSRALRLFAWHHVRIARGRFDVLPATGADQSASVEAAVAAHPGGVGVAE